MKAVVHRRGDANRDKHTILPRSVSAQRAQQVGEGVGKAFGLVDLIALHATHGTHDAIAGTDHGAWVGVNRAGTGLELANEAVVQAVELLLFRLGQIQVSKRLPGGDGQVAHQRVGALAEPAHKAGEGQAGYPVGQQEIEVFLGTHGVQ